MRDEVKELADIVRSIIRILPTDLIGFMMKEKLMTRIRRLEGKLDGWQNAGED